MIIRRKFQLPLLAAILLVAANQPSYPDQQDEALLVYAVKIEMRSWPGNAVYIGKGLFLTAAHVVGRTWLSKPQVLIADKRIPAEAIKEGSPRGTDLTLLGVDERLLPMRLRLRRNRLCADPPWPGEEVVTVAFEAAVHTHIIPSGALPQAFRNLTSVIGDVATTGNSGSGVFDARQKCLLGIITQKISQPRIRHETGEVEVQDIAKYFIPASVIDDFMPPESRF
jgi:hypothetical protein